MAKHINMLSHDFKSNKELRMYVLVFIAHGNYMKHIQEIAHYFASKTESVRALRSIQSQTHKALAFKLNLMAGPNKTDCLKRKTLA